MAYAFQAGTGSKHEAARNLVQDLGDRGDGVTSIQVLNELFVTLTRKLRPGTPVSTAREIVSELSTAWAIVDLTPADVLLTIDNATRWQISYWDALILTSAAKAGATVVWTEDLNHGQAYGPVTVRNPFR